MSGPFRRARSAAIGCLVCLFLIGALGPQPLDAQDEVAGVGTVTALVGEVTVTGHGETEPRPLEEGRPVFEGDRIVTGAGARVRLELVDGSVLQLGENTELYLDWVLHAPAYESRNVVLELAAGILRSVVEAIAPRSRVELRTETAVASVRGTEWITEATAASAIVTLDGQVAVRNRREDVAGEVVLGPGEGTTVEADAPPTEPSVWGDARRESFIERSAIGRP